MLKVVNKLFAPKVPTADIAGAALTHNEAAELMHTCTALKNALHLQLDAVSKMPDAFEKHVNSKIHQIQIHHTDIHAHLTIIISKTGCSKALWVHEFADARAALERRIVAINRRSRGLGWINVARQCWPGVAFTYGWLLPLVLRLQDELRQALKQKDQWSPARTLDEADEKEKQESAALYTNDPRVHFAREAMVREYQVESAIDEQSVRRPFFADLSDDSPPTAGRFKGKKAKFVNRLSDSDL